MEERKTVNKCCWMGFVGSTFSLDIWYGLHRDRMTVHRAVVMLMRKVRRSSDIHQVISNCFAVVSLSFGVRSSSNARVLQNLTVQMVRKNSKFNK